MATAIKSARNVVDVQPGRLGPDDAKLAATLPPLTQQVCKHFGIERQRQIAHREDPDADVIVLTFSDDSTESYLTQKGHCDVLKRRTSTPKDAQLEADIAEIAKRGAARITKRGAIEQAIGTRVVALQTQHKIATPEQAYAKFVAGDAELTALELEKARLDGRIEGDEDDADDGPADVIGAMVAEKCALHVEKIAKLEAAQQRAVGDFAMAHNMDMFQAQKRVEAISAQAATLGTKTDYLELGEQIEAAKSAQLLEALTLRARFEKAGAVLLKHAAADDAPEVDDEPGLPPVHAALEKRVREFQAEQKIPTYEQAFAKATGSDPVTRLLYDASKNEPEMTDEQVESLVERHAAPPRPFTPGDVMGHR